MLRTVKYLSLLVVQFIGALLGVGALFIAFYAVSTPLSEFESAGWRILGMAFACGMMFPFVLQASLIQSYMPLPLSMGVTRRGFFAGAQAAKVMLAGGIGVCLLLIQLAVKWMFGVDALFTGTMLVGLFAVLLLGASVGEALGFVSLRFGRVGMIVFFVLIVGGYAVIGGIIGYAGRHAGRDAALSFQCVGAGRQRHRFGRAVGLAGLAHVPPHTGKGVSIYVKIDQTGIPAQPEQPVAIAGCFGRSLAAWRGA